MTATQKKHRKPAGARPEITGKTRIFGVIADPIEHVRAPMLFNPLMAEHGIDGVLIPLHIRAENLAETMRALAGMPNFGGACVTIPHKLAMAELCDEVGLAAEITGAVNVVRFENGRMIGGNFDGEGFIAGLEGEGVAMKDKQKNILLLGAGGAARGIAAAIAEHCRGEIVIANRTRATADNLAALINTHFGGTRARAIDMADAGEAAGAAEIIINATSLGLNSGDALPLALDGGAIRKEAIIADIIMVPEETPWLREAEALGFKTHRGRHMLDYQRKLIARFLKML